MRKLLAPLLVALLVPLAALAGGAINLNQAGAKTFTDCSSGGSAAQTIVQGQYLLTVTDENSWLCLAASASTCVSVGTKYPVGTVMLLSFSQDQLSVSCRSTSSTGDIQLTPAD